MSNSDSGRPPPQQPRRRVLRKIASRGDASTSVPSDRPSFFPSDRPSSAPSDRPSFAPADRPSSAPNPVPTPQPRADASDPFDLLANAARAPSPGLERMLERSSPSMYPPPAASSGRPLTSAAQLPSFDTPGPATPPPSPRRGSLPPVVASVADQALDAHALARPAASVRRAGLIGGALGLAFVAMFVVGARLAYRPAEPATPALSSVAATATALPPSAAPPAPSVVVTAAPSATEFTLVIQSPPRQRTPGVRTATPGGSGPKFAPTTGIVAPEVGASNAAATVSSRVTSPVSPNSSEAPDNPNPLVPVIPSASTPELDPLVKAVLEEDRPANK